MKLHELCDLIVDCEHKTAPIEESGYPSIRTPNIGRGVFLLDGVNRVSEETYKEWTKRAIPIPGDLIMAREAPVGNVAIIPEGLVPCLGQRTLLIRPDKHKVSNQYLCYLLLGKEVQHRIHSLTNGATVPHLNMKDVRLLELPVLPDRKVQDRIASILSAYDDLIENNTRRIAILEEMARLIYREWFVHFRFPGHEKAKFVNSELGRIPEGWVVRAIGELVEFTKGRKPDEIRLRGEDGDALLLLIDYLRGGSPQYCSPIKMVMSKPTDTIMVMDGASSCEVFFGEEGCIGSTLGRFRSKGDRLSDAMLYEYLSAARAENSTKNVGSAIPHANKDYILRQIIPLPPFELASEFDSLSQTMHDAIKNFKLQNRNLRRTRDLLLPRLISGEIDVSNLKM